MGIIYYQQPELNRPDMIASWPGIGNIGVVTVETLRNQFGATGFAEIEPWDFFYPKQVIIKSGILQNMVFPASKFYYTKLEKRDLILFIGDEQPAESGGAYAQGKKAYQMANLVLDVAQKFDCRRVYTSGAAVASTHHTFRPRVWTVASHPYLVDVVRTCRNSVLMSEVEGLNGGGSISGLNGLLLGLAKKRGFESVCFMGEIPDYLSGSPFPYPRASKSVVEVLASILGVRIDYKVLDEMTTQIDEIINDIYNKLPQDVREKVEQRKQPSVPPITEEDEKWMKEHIEELFQKGGRGDERAA